MNVFMVIKAQQQASAVGAPLPAGGLRHSLRNEARCRVRTSGIPLVRQRLDRGEWLIAPSPETAAGRAGCPTSTQGPYSWEKPFP